MKKPFSARLTMAVDGFRAALTALAAVGHYHLVLIPLLIGEQVWWRLNVIALSCPSYQKLKALPDDYYANLWARKLLSGYEPG